MELVGARHLLQHVADREVVAADRALRPGISITKVGTSFDVRLRNVDYREVLDERNLCGLSIRRRCVERGSERSIQLVIEAVPTIYILLCRDPVLLASTAQDLDKAAVATRAQWRPDASHLEEEAAFEAERMVSHVAIQLGGNDTLSGDESPRRGTPDPWAGTLCIGTWLRAVPVRMLRRSCLCVLAAIGRSWLCLCWAS
mmetsp:Transcript_73228/g.210331  ORF Transcript_73228/g.210331 Transcript_73228/m.210331 type:complete len:200 (-) Transcript_73228:171-770(-)|eukprot:CAMPEP_0177179100 /NCGR_PEP_ID=MMETSP0367-20130122/14680_1 /TAXON_ID=447022 ORGANISM="Scrippsiella hangoei-like, Strain SHHI-4" /NCGR_SAMPLE_ID=MMETSP0367 /ASSEMBLY_ACC=CAM_ASM_000362 /LENGTH=199 /DNA_ID=CAMNT_0018625799 /DNA_START=380 /DNA_END=979 /DNA_ORIENTATION=+